MARYLWGKVAGVWHALTRHDPEYFYDLVESKSLTERLRRKFPNADPVMVQAPARDAEGKLKKAGPGIGATLCSQSHTLEEIGIDPSEDDVLCPVCNAAAQS